MIRAYLWSSIRTHLWRFGLGAIIMVPLVVGIFVLAGIALAIGKAVAWAVENPVQSVAILIAAACYAVGLYIDLHDREVTRG